jgi:diguanylate cyclase (GGDEF)-like protein
MTFRELPTGAQIHVGLVIAAGALVCAWAAAAGAFDHPLITLTLVLASIAAATLKTDLPLSSSYSTLSIGYTVNFASLLQFGPGMSVLAAASGGWAQCTLNTKQRNPWYRTAFSMSTLALATLAASTTLTLTGGRVLNGPADVVLPAIVAAALVYFLVNAALMALAVGLSTRRSALEVLDREFIWGLPNYFIGALAATMAVAGLHRFGLRSAVLLVVPLVLTYRLYKVYLSRVDEMSRANKELHVEVERAQAESLTDPLTGLPNRRFLADHTVQEIARAERQGESFAFIMIDLDEFKAINDSYGHQRGDDALNAVAAAVRGALRSYDVCCRYAGDEFAVVLSNCPPDLAHRRADAITASIASLPFEGASGFLVPLSASAGVAMFPGDGRTYHELLAAADARMYARKRSHARVESRV